MNDSVTKASLTPRKEYNNDDYENTQYDVITDGSIS